MQSKVGEGTTFIIRLPVPPSEPAQLPEPVLLDGTPFPSTKSSEALPSEGASPEGAAPPPKPAGKPKREKKRRAS